MDAVIGFANAVFQPLIDLGAAPMMTIVLTVIALLFKVKFTKALEGGLKLGIAITGIGAIINILSHVVESRNFESGTHILHVRAITDILLRQLVCTSRNGAQNRKEASWLTTNFSLACSPQRRR